MNRTKYIIWGIVLLGVLVMTSCCVTGFCPVESHDANVNEIQTKTYTTDQ